jgi:hypothetical protein
LQSCVLINIILLSIVLLSFIQIDVVLSVVLPNVAVSHERAPSVSPKKGSTKQKMHVKDKRSSLFAKLVTKNHLTNVDIFNCREGQTKESLPKRSSLVGPL